MAPALANRVTTDTTVEVSLSPKLRKTLAVKVKAYEDIQQQIGALESKAATIKAEVEQAFEDGREMNALLAGVKINGTPVKMICGVRKSFNKMKFQEAGGDLEVWEAAHDLKPSKPYVKIGGNRKKEEE